MPKTRTLLQSPKTTEANNAMKTLTKKIARLLHNDGSPKDYIRTFYEIPAFRKDIRNNFLCEIYRKAKKENWLAEKLGNIMKVIG